MADRSERMKTGVFLIVALVAVAASLLGRQAVAQDVVYFARGGDQLANARITDATNENVVVVTLRDGTFEDYAFSRTKVLMAFTKAGNYLLISDLSASVAQAKEQIQAFLTAPLRSDSIDYLIKRKTALPTIIPAQIVYEDKEVVQYRASDGSETSVSKAELVAILYKDGRHQLTTTPVEAAPILADARVIIINEGKPNTAFEPGPAAIMPSPPAAPLSLDNSTSKPDTIAQLPPGAGQDASNEQSLRQVERFVAYIAVICDRNTTRDDKERAVREATQLFLPESTVKVTSAKQASVRTMSVGQYLTRLMLLPYLSTRLESVQTLFVSDITQMADRNYYGTIIGVQTLKYGADQKITYSEVTPTNGRVRLETYPRTVDRQNAHSEQVLLGNVSMNDAQQ